MIVRVLIQFGEGYKEIQYVGNIKVVRDEDSVISIVEDGVNTIAEFCQWITWWYVK
jgi:hypothetical protein